MRFLPVCALLVLSACANPVKVPPLDPQDEKRSCEALWKDVEKTREYKRLARAEDQFDWKYVFVVNAFVSAYSMNAAEKAAEQRLQGLERMLAQKGCPQHSMPAPSPEATAGEGPVGPLPQ